MRWNDRFDGEIGCSGFYYGLCFFGVGDTVFGDGDGWLSVELGGASSLGSCGVDLL